MKPNGTLILKRSEVASLLSLEECIGAVEEAFRMHEEGQSLPPGVLETLTMDGGFHIKAAGLTLDAKPYYAAKVNANFPQNKSKWGLPAIQGIIALFDSHSGYPLALLDSIEITILRTGAVSAVAAKYLARPDSRVATICGCGVQGRVQLKALMQVLRLEKVYAYDQDQAHSGRFADEMSRELKIEVVAVTDLPSAIQESNVCVTCTPSRRPFLMREHVRPGTFVAAVGADNPLKHEVEPALLAANKVVVDVLEQCATIGDLHHAIAAGVMSKSDVYAALGAIVAGRTTGRASAEEIIIFDSTGTALQDVAAASVVYQKALQAGLGVWLNLAA
ncbi:MAG TPA: ornithine cyclodeaminase family protein [Pyrinomonadaceae bacterium]|nr:ornithine cyclodeaminase family protein [Pyrinomonadaceae bacterium]